MSTGIITIISIVPNEALDETFVVNTYNHLLVEPDGLFVNRWYFHIVDRSIAQECYMRERAQRDEETHKSKLGTCIFSSSLEKEIYVSDRFPWESGVLESVSDIMTEAQKKIQPILPFDIFAWKVAHCCSTVKWSDETTGKEDVDVTAGTSGTDDAA